MTACYKPIRPAMGSLMAGPSASKPLIRKSLPMAVGGEFILSSVPAHPGTLRERRRDSARWMKVLIALRGRWRRLRRSRAGSPGGEFSAAFYALPPFLLEPFLQEIDILLPHGHFVDHDNDQQGRQGGQYGKNKLDAFHRLKIPRFCGRPVLCFVEL